MRIVCLAPFALTPKGTVRARALPVARTLAAAGHQVSLIVPPLDNPSQSGLVLQDAGVEIINLNLHAGSRLGRLALAGRLARLAFSKRPELVWIWKPLGDAALAGLFLRPFVRRLIVDADDWEGSGGWATVNRRSLAWRVAVDAQEALTPRLADWVTVASRYLANRYQQIVAPDRVAYLPNCLSGDERRPDPARVAALRNRLNLPAETPLAVFAGYLPPVNDLDLALDALALARNRVPDLKLLLISDGPGVAAARRYWAGLGMAEAVVETGPVSEADLPDYLGLARLALGPYRDSLVNQARCSVKILHYLAAERPVVATSVGENLAFIQTGRSGFLVPPDDPVAFAEAMIELATNPDRSAAFGAFGREDVLTRFRWADQILPRLPVWVR